MFPLPPARLTLCSWQHALSADHKITQGFTIDGQLDDEDVEESYIDKCIFVEGQAAPTMLTHQGQEVESALIGTVIDGLKIQNCG